jgi:hypothetical protein
MKLPDIKTFEFDDINLSGVFERNFSRDQSSQYANVVEFRPPGINSVQDLLQLKDYVERSYLLTNRGFELDKLWLVESFPEDIAAGELPFIPHIDYQRFLKVMVYVDNVTTECGPFSAITCDPEIWEDRRLALPANYKQSLQNQVTEFAMDEYKSFVGEPGAIILFDTNCPHFAGVVSPGHSRRVFRFDYLKPAWRRSESQFSKFKRTVSRMIFS